MKLEIKYKEVVVKQFDKEHFRIQVLDLLKDKKYQSGILAKMMGYSQAYLSNLIYEHGKSHFWTARMAQKFCDAVKLYDDIRGEIEKEIAAEKEQRRQHLIRLWQKKKGQ